MPDLDELRAFAAVARAESFSTAAQQLHLTQSAVSRRVARLERALGLRLLRRTSRSVHLTPSGQRLLRHVETVLRLHEALLQASADERSGLVAKDPEAGHP